MFGYTAGGMNIFKSYGGLSRPVYILFFANIINRMGDFVKMFLTLYLTQVLHLAEKDAGTFVMMSAGASTIGGLIGGRLSDTIGRRRILILFFLLSGLIVGSCGFIPPSILTAWLLVPASMCIGGVRPVINSVVADLTGREERAKAYSLLYLGVNIGVSIGPMIAGFLFARYLRWIFWGDALTTFGALVLILLFVPETRPMGGSNAVESAYGAGKEEPGKEEQSLPGNRGVSNDSGEDESHLPEEERSEPGSIWRALLRRPVVLLFAPPRLLLPPHLCPARLHPSPPAGQALRRRRGEQVRLHHVGQCGSGAREHDLRAPHLRAEAIAQ